MNAEPTALAGAPARPRDVLRAHVAARVNALQMTHLGGASTATATLARLRRAVTAAPGSDPAVWEITIGALPAGLVGRGDDPSRAEHACHGALTLYAVHQQSQSQGMHQVGVGLGTAVRRLAGTASEAGVIRRFQALGTATTYSEALHHARGLITQLRGATVCLDYGRFAVDLFDLQDARRADAVRLVWGRDFYRVTDQPETSTPTDASNPTVNGDPQ